MSSILSQAASTTLTQLSVLLCFPHAAAMDSDGSYIPGICQQGTGCAYQAFTHACVTNDPMRDLIASLDPRVVGMCSSVCYLRMLDTCHKAAAQPAAIKAAWCSKQPGCLWDGGSCRADVYLSTLDQWGKQVLAASKSCAAQKEEHACAAAGVKGALPMQSLSKRSAEFVAAPINTGSASVKCPV